MINYKKIYVLNLNNNFIDETYKKLLKNRWHFVILDSRGSLNVLTKEKSIFQINDEQKFIFEVISGNILQRSPQNCFFIDGPGGSGKTYLYSLLIDFPKSNQNKVLTLAYTRITRTLLQGGRTIHSTFHLPLNIYQDLTIQIQPDSIEARLLNEYDVILIDEISMVNKYIFNAIDNFFLFE